jgi:hypothetical protein
MNPRAIKHRVKASVPKNPRAAADHVHGYEPDGTKIKVNNDPRIPTTGG